MKQIANTVRGKRLHRTGLRHTTTAELLVGHAGSQNATTPRTDQGVLGIQDSGMSEEQINDNDIKTKTWQQRERKTYHRIFPLRSAVHINDKGPGVDQ